MKTRFEIALIGAVFALSSQSAFAYLDPGTGSALIQGLIAAVAAVGVTIKLYWHRIIGFFGSAKPKNDQDVENEVE